MRGSQHSPKCFLAVPIKQLHSTLRQAIQDGVRAAGYRLVTIEEVPIASHIPAHEGLLSAIADADCVIAEVSNANPNVFFEIGLAEASGKVVLLLADGERLSRVPFDVRNLNVLTYLETDRLEDLARRIAVTLNSLRISPRPVTSELFYVDWDSLDPREAENLCRELLSQMGYRKLDWGKGSPEVDLIAELPKTDPDGFEYKELWLISMGLHAPFEIVVEMASHEPDYLLHRLSRYSENFDEMATRYYDGTATLLLIFIRNSAGADDIESVRERLERRRKRGRPHLRVRFWDQDYLTSLVHKFPGIGYKYFSQEGRIRSKTRKSYEELAQENEEAVSRLARQNKVLQDEKNRRISAERDAIWKDISFAAAHKIGNPIFAIETDLEPLALRVRSGRTEEALEVIENIESSVDKAKSIVEQFKSLTKAQENHPEPILLKPILDDACKSANSHGVDCTLECPEGAIVYGDPDRLTECFDELVVNACHWFDKPAKRISIEALTPAPQPLPDSLDSSLNYLLVHVRDNGCGVPAQDKALVFDAFFTRRDHGTGLGLALVRRIIEGHRGGIIEVGIPNEGADFLVFLPIERPGKRRKDRKSRSKSQPNTDASAVKEDEE